MEESELLEIAARGEDSRHQFKVDVTNPDSMAAEIVAFANSGGGRIFVGVRNDGSIEPHDAQSVGRLNQLISNAASQSVRPPINPATDNVATDQGAVVVVTVLDGLRKPYTDAQGSIWVKSGSDKRRVTAVEEMQRMFQESGLVHADDQPVPGTSLADLDPDYFASFYEKRFGDALDEQEQSLQQVLSNMRLLRDDMLTMTGLLLFGENPHALLPAFHVKAIAYPGADVDVETYLDSEDFTGKLEDQFSGAMGFLRRNLRKTQPGQDVNAPGELEIPQIVLEELLTNALIHRDFSISAPVRVFVFNDRVEMISPGHLPNNLTVANILSGNSNMRNPTLSSFATHILPYRGIGNGIVRARKAYAEIDFVDDCDGSKFLAVIRRPSLG
ncbi:MAG: ATP-dependent DNA helicase RecG [Planctomycetes bacterium]|nr:ATP-dependent DNA helicase RecG [Planctomycetota bacterium]